jgi:hypothetical protein
LRQIKSADAMGGARDALFDAAAIPLGAISEDADMTGRQSSTV